MGDALQLRRTVALIAVVVLGLATVARAEEWFDAYSRGVEALSKKDASRAAEHLERAIRMRPEPGNNVFTYGTNRIVAYHPYLRLAEARLLAGDVAGARAALGESERRRREPAGERLRLRSLADAAEEPVPPPSPPSAPATTLAPAPVVVATPESTRPTPLASAPTAEPTPAPARAERPVPEPAVAAPTPPRVAPSPLSAATPRAAGEGAALEIFSEPPAALVYLDDEPLGQTDPVTGRLVKTGIRPGPHRLRAGRPGSEDVTVQITVSAEGSNLARLALPEHPGRLHASLALAAVLAAAALALVLWRRRKAEPGSAVTAAPGATPAPPEQTTIATPRSGSRPSPVSATPFDEAFPTLQRPPGPGVPAPFPESFGEYRLLGLLGRGGMAQVFRAERHGEQFALKRPLLSFLDEREFLERFLREAEIGRTLHHPNIVRIFERGEVQGVPFFTMELVEGESLHARLRAGPLAPRAAAEVVCQVAEALDYAHLKGVVHRDLKPSNIMVLPEGVVKVMDYGIARARRFEGLTATGAFLGTPEYAAPEAAEGLGCDARSDLYSLGVTFYEMLTGRKPFVGDTAYATIRKHCTEAPTPPSAHVPLVPRVLEETVLRLLAKRPEERFSGAEELLVELRGYLSRADRAV